MGGILEVKDLCKIMGVHHTSTILKNINLVIAAGEFVSLMGPSGSGKSTLLYNVSGMDRASSGSVTLDGQSLSGLNEKELARIRLQKMGFIFQQPYLLKNLSLLDNITLPAYLLKDSCEAEISDRAKSLMQKMGIQEIADHAITQASGGQLQRVSICRALINHPQIVFGDEPTGALNSRSATEVLDILSDFNNAGTTIFLATHDIKVAARTERVIYIRDGEIVDEYKLGKNSRQMDVDQEREKALTAWLVRLGF